MPNEQPSTAYVWQGEDDPGRLDAAAVCFGGDRLSAHGTSHTGSYAVSWSLVTGTGWITQRLMVTVHGRGWRRQLDLTRSEQGVWSAAAAEHGSSGLPAPGLVDADGLTGVLDCDLGLCPLTNTMPILRHDLLAPGARPAPTLLTMAWVEVPSLQVLPSRQSYRPLSPAAADRPATVVYESADGDFQAELSVDAQGVVLDYPGLARRVRCTP